MGAVVSLPVAENVQAAFDEYAALIVEARDNAALRIDDEHTLRTERAWNRFISLFSKWRPQ